MVGFHTAQYALAGPRAVPRQHRQPQALSPAEYSALHMKRSAQSASATTAAAQWVSDANASAKLPSCLGAWQPSCAVQQPSPARRRHGVGGSGVGASVVDRATVNVAASPVSRKPLQLRFNMTLYESM